MNGSRRSLRRYSRHLLVPEVGLAGQEKLARARVLVVGAGGLGSPVLQYLAAAGVGRIGIVDDDDVDLTNLQRQVLFAEEDIGKNKALAARDRLVLNNSQIAYDAYPVRVDASNVRELVRAYDVVADCTDTFGARYLLSDAARLEGRVDVFASIFRFDGQLSVFAPDGPCYRCLFPEPPPEGSVPSCAEGGVLGVLAGVVGTLQAAEVLKVILGIGAPLTGRLMLVDALGAQTREIAFSRDPACPLDGDRPQITDVADVVAARAPVDVPEIAGSDLDAFLAEHPHARLLDVREPHERILGDVADSVRLPASELEARMHELDSAQTYVVACRVGAKSRYAVARLRDAGFARLYHLEGGLLSYAAVHDEFAFF
jgi:adenylyltransferase/sulfurtransferase